jgi:multicomponent Na+:H+ antiporter subunit G
VILGKVFLVAAFVFFTFGVIAQFRFRDFYRRLLVAGISDTAGLILFFTGVILLRGAEPSSLKLFFLLVIILLINPLAAHKLGRSAYHSRLGENDEP